MSAMATPAPATASARAIAPPMPPVPPVTIARRPLRSVVIAGASSIAGQRGGVCRRWSAGGRRLRRHANVMAGPDPVINPLPAQPARDLAQKIGLAQRCLQFYHAFHNGGAWTSRGDGVREVDRMDGNP